MRQGVCGESGVSGLVGALAMSIPVTEQRNGRPVIGIVVLRVLRRLSGGGGGCGGALSSLPSRRENVEE